MSTVAETSRQSRGRRRAGRFLSRSWQALVTLLLAVALGVLAFVSPGLVQADVKLNDGTVYVGHQGSGLIGTLNAEIDELAGATQVSGNQFRILQDEKLVVVHGVEASTLGRYNPAMNRMESPSELPNGAEVQMAGGTMVVAVPDSGKVYYGAAADVLEFEFSQREADFEVGQFGTATVTSDGQVIGLNAERSVLVRPTPEGLVETPLPFQLDSNFTNVSLSAVGDKALVLDRQSGRIWLEGTSKAFEVSGAAGAQLMRPAPDAIGGHDGAKAVYATQAGLIALTADGPRSLSGNLNATAVQPVQVGDCVYAAFDDQFVKQCKGQNVQIRPIPEYPEGAQLTFHVNRRTVVLNDLASGTIWMVDKDMLIIKDWTPVQPSEQRQEDEVGPSDDVVQPDLDKPNRPPTAGDDQLAARAGRSTILPVLDNDSDPDGDVLTLSAQSELTGASLQVVRGGSGLQVTIDDATTGTLTFTYTVDDGRGGNDTATVTLEVLPADPQVSNRPPFRSPLATPVRIQLGQKLDKRVLLDWRDPDGDSLILVDAWLPPTSEDELSFTPDGEVSFRDIGKTTGTKKVFVKISDGLEVSQGEMLLEVVDEVVPPLAFGDFETTAVNKPVTIRPLDNDIGSNLSLTEVVPYCDNCTVTPNYREKWFTFTATKPGTYLVLYRVSNGPLAVGMVRIEVRAETSQHPPVAAMDVALLPPGGSVLVDPLLNDTDEDGDVLVVQSITTPPGIEAVLGRRHLVTISASHTPDKPVTLTYRVSDGKDWALGTILVIPTPATGSAAPQAERDQLLVRAGATQAINVLDNDTSPVGLELTLDKLVNNPLGDNAWIDGNRIRVSVPPGTQASTANITYQVRDEDGAVASSQLQVTVVSEDVANVPPVPRPVVERVLAGTTSRLLIPLEGVDANGDAVRLVGLGSGPQLGRVLAVGDGWMTYEAYSESKGTDIFSYQVVDSYGVVGTGEIRVGVAPPGPDNAPPTAVSDEVMVRPGRPVHIPALRNDVDIDGDAITFMAGEGAVEMDDVTDARVVDNREITFTAPEQEGEYSGTYHIQDSRGMAAAGYIMLTVSEDAPPVAPETRDDLVQVSSVIGKDYVEVDPLANDFDPDGAHDDLRVSIPDAAEDGPRVTGNKVTVPVTERMQQVRYQVSDADGLSATGLILVPGRNDSVPVLKDPELVMEAVAGQPLAITINNVVAGTAGRSVTLTSVDGLAVTHGNATAGQERIEYTPDITYDGPASVVFEVKDVVPEGDKTGKRAFISIPVKVAPSPVADKTDSKDAKTAKSSPQLRGANPVLTVAPDEGKFPLDLAPFFEDPDGDSFFFEKFREGDGNASIEWEVEKDGGSRIQAWAPVSAKPGTYRVLHGQVRDASDAITPFTMRLEVTSSRRPLAVAGADVIDEAMAGREITIPVLENDKSNLLNDKQLTLIPESAKVISGAGTIRTEGNVVRLTPAPDFVGTLTARYTIIDATGDPDRRVDGTIRATVKARPGRPNAPRDGQAGNGQVTFTYTPGPSNGYEIKSRVAVALNAQGAQVASTECESTTCTVTGLPNGRPYTFRVQEINDAGPSEWSPTSAAWTPDQTPNAPEPPVATFGDSQLTVAWKAPSWANPSNPGSPISSYKVVLTDDAGRTLGEKSVAASTTQFVWTGLTNGARYRFQVAAINAAGSSPLSQPSNVEYPAGPPGPVSQVSASPTGNELGGAFTVSFSANANPNGDAVAEYIITPIREGNVRLADKAVKLTPTGNAQLQVIIEGLGQVGHRFEVVARNKAGLGKAAATPNFQVAWQLPRIDNFEVQPGDGSVLLKMQTNYDRQGGAPVVREYRMNGGNWTAWPSDNRVTGLTNGRSHKFEAMVRVDDRVATSGAREAVPRSGRPGFPKPDPESLTFRGQHRGFMEVTWELTRMDWEKTGGWDPSKFTTSCTAKGRCSPKNLSPVGQYTLQSRALQDEPEEVTVTINHADAQQQTAHVLTVERPFEGTFDAASKKVDFTLRYVRNAKCQVTHGDKTREVQQGANQNTLTQSVIFEPDTQGSGAAIDCTWDGGSLSREI